MQCQDGREIVVLQVVFVKMVEENGIVQQREISAGE
jgi:hypothetical protein